jgi:hypothetical protein
MTRIDRRVRYRVYQGFRDDGAPPPVARIAAAEGVTSIAVRASLGRLAAEHEIVLGPGDPGVWMAHPFSGVSTDYRVTIGDAEWFANCAWDALGIASLLGDASVSTVSPLDGTEWSYRVTEDTVEPEGFVYFPVPARAFWDDIGYT